MLNFFEAKTGKVINVNDIDNLIGTVEIIDIREPYECQRGILETAKNIPMGTLLGRPEQFLDKEKTYYLICQSGARSGQAQMMLSKMGYNVVNVAGGMGSYAGAKKEYQIN